MTRFSNFPIRIQLIVLAIILTLPALGIIIYSGLRGRSEDYRKAAVESQKLADNLAAEMENLVHDARQLSTILSELPDVKNRNVDKVQTILTNTIKRYPQYHVIVIADETGAVWASTSLPIANNSIAERRYFKNVRLTQQFSSGEFVLSQKTQKPTIHLAYPLTDSNGFRGAVVIGFDLENMKSILERSQLPPNTNYILVDHKGVIISRGRDNGQITGKMIQLADLNRMEGGPDKETYEFVRIDGDRRVTTYRKIRLPGEQTPFMYVRAGLSIKDAVAQANKRLVYNIAALLPFVVIAFGMALLIGKRSIVNRVVKLQMASEQIANGDLETRVAHLVGGGELGKLGEAFDVMAKKLADYLIERQHATEEYRAIIQTTTDGFFVCDAAGNIRDANSAYCAIVGYTGIELMSMNISDIEAMEDFENLKRHISSKIKSSGSDTFRSKHRCKDGTTVDVEVTVTFLSDRGGRFYSFVRDITDRKKLEEDLFRAATYDRLTGVFNREAQEDKISSEMERSKRYGNEFSLIMLDIDDFKKINDTLGHQAGDRVLSGIAKIILKNIRIVDSVGRWGGEEFMILLTDTKGPEAVLVAEKLRTALAQSNFDEAANVTASFGVTAYQADDSFDSIIKRVDDLLYLSKNLGKNRVEVSYLTNAHEVAAPIAT